MIFIRYENFRSYLKYYPVTSLILAANLVMYIILLLNGGSDDTSNLLHFGAVGSEPPYSEELWRYVVAIFLHHGFDHLLFNCFAILVFAPPLERLLGWWRYVLLYLGSGVLGNVLSMALYRNEMVETISVGASGAIYGVYGAFLYIGVPRGTHLLAGESPVTGGAKPPCSLDTCVRRNLCVEAYRRK
ncbi:rhomboid family intramembrane serine protease, partial [Paenibacillus caui]|uniref:rhomboid family intramembrane serine protease n=1 Tax=Paenibacillus caui TaxID=2873927 RepID=UPI001CAA2255